MPTTAEVAKSERTPDRSSRSWPVRLHGQPLAQPFTRIETLWLAIVTGFAFAAAASMGGGSWLPAGDDAVVVTRARDVLSSAPPILGMPSSLALASGELTHHPGPLLFVWFAPFVTVLGRVAGGAFGAVTLNLLAIVAAWWFARSMLGPRTGVLIGTIGLLVVLGLPPVYLPLNSALSAGGTFAVLITAWAVLMAVPRSLYALLFFASMTAQAHVAYGLVTLSVAGPVVAWDLLRRWRANSRHGPGSALRSVAPVFAVATLLWIGPLLDRGRNLIDLAGSSSGTVSRGPVQAFATISAVLGRWPIIRDGSTYPVRIPIPKKIGELFTGEVSSAAILMAGLGLALLGWACWRHVRAIRQGTTVLVLALMGTFVGTAMLPVGEPLDSQLFWARCVSLFAFLLYFLAARPLWDPLWHGIHERILGRSQLARVGAVAIVALGLAALAARLIGPQWTVQERILAERMTARAEVTEALRSDDETALIALGGVATPAAVAAEQATFGLAAARIEQGRPTFLDAAWYWGDDRTLRDRGGPMTAVVVSPRPAPVELPDGWTEVAELELADRPAPNLPDRVASAVAASGEQITLTADATSRVPAVVDGLLPGGCEDPAAWIADPTQFVQRAPEALVALYRAGLVEAPALPPELEGDLWSNPAWGLWVYRVEGEVAQELARVDRLVLNRLGCPTG